MKNDKNESRKYVMSGIVLLIFFVYLATIFSLQINNSEESQSQADRNACYKKTIYPARGLIYDRNDSLLVYNKVSYDITFIPLEIKGIDTLDLCNTLGITFEDFNARMTRVKETPGYSKFTEQTFIAQIPEETLSIFQEFLYSQAPCTTIQI